jgi:hypothetical protein
MTFHVLAATFHSLENVLWFLIILVKPALNINSLLKVLSVQFVRPQGIKNQVKFHCLFVFILILWFYQIQCVTIFIHLVMPVLEFVEKLQIRYVRNVILQGQFVHNMSRETSFASVSGNSVWCFCKTFNTS